MSVVAFLAPGSVFLVAQGLGSSPPEGSPAIGREVSIARHLDDGEEYQIATQQLIDFGKKLFTAMWTIQEGAGRPLSKGTGALLSDPSDPLVFPRNSNRISGPDTNSCSGCHNKPLIGGGGDIVGNVFVLAQRFDFATFNQTDTVPTDGGVDEMGNPVFSAANWRGKPAATTPPRDGVRLSLAADSPVC